MTEIAVRRDERSSGAEIAERVMLVGDLSKLTPAERVSYYAEVCRSLGLNPLTRPFDYIALSGKLTLYAKRDCTDQLRALHRVSVTITARELVGDVYVVTAKAISFDGRQEESIGAVAVAGLKGEALANAYMKAETKAKRRVTLSLVGLGWLDESEADSVAGAQRIRVQEETGEILADPEDRDSTARHITLDRKMNAAIATEDPRSPKRREMEDVYASLIVDADHLQVDENLMLEFRGPFTSLDDAALRAKGRELRRLIELRRAEIEIEDEQDAEREP